MARGGATLSGSVQSEPQTPPAVVKDQAQDQAEAAFRIGFFGNTALALSKLGIGWLAGSRALLADGTHSLSDVASNGGAWLAHRFSRRAPDDDHHYGHGKAEAFAGLVVGMLLIVGGLAVIWESNASTIELATGWKAGLALGMAVVSIAANLGLAWLTQRAARSTRSPGLAALARDNGSDALAGALVVLGILGSWWGVGWAEPTAAVLIGAMIAWMGWRSSRDSFDLLMDRSDPRLRAAIAETAAAVAQVRGVQSVRVHPLGSSHGVDLEISVDGKLTVEEGHRIAHSVERATTTAHSSVQEVHVHVNPWTPATGGSAGPNQGSAPLGPDSAGSSGEPSATGH